MTLGRVVAEMDVDFGGSIGETTGVFHFYGDVEVDEQIRTGFLVGKRGSSVNGIIQDHAEAGEPKRKGAHIDAGGGQHALQLNFRGWEGATDSEGTALQWGDDPNPGLSRTSATGADATSQVNVFNEYLRVGTFDSRNPIRVRYGEFSDGTYASESGVLDSYLECVIESPSLKRDAEEGNTFTGSLTFVETLTASETIDAIEKLDY